MQVKLGVFLSIFLVALLLSSVACGGGTGSAPDPKASKKSTSPKSVAPGNISGTVLFTGTKPKSEMIDFSSDPVCRKAHPQKASDNNFVLSPDGLLGNVVVTIIKGLEGKEFPEQTSSVVINQKDCIYTPRVVFMQPGYVEFTSYDPTLHNVRSRSKKNKPFNRAMPTPGSYTTEFTKEEIVPITCDVHNWMRAYIIVAQTIGDVTGVEGSFSLKGLPPGKYTVQAWHEELEPITRNVRVKSGKTANLDFEFKATG